MSLTTDLTQKKLYSFKADTTFYANDIDDATRRLAIHFLQFLYPEYSGKSLFESGRFEITSENGGGIFEKFS